MDASERVFFDFLSGRPDCHDQNVGTRRNTILNLASFDEEQTSAYEVETQGGAKDATAGGEVSFAMPLARHS